ncbi:MAG: hypothetical protein L0Y72_27310 [Gemmataceae bacterium]|nr:hypothetical protein [Gemmataceae bacterium]MCI0742760.1 hypothetical protein [Gemmataceae bacterium]
MTRKQKLFLCLAAGHLLLVGYHVLGLPLPGVGNPAGDTVRWYSSISGAHNRYGFFKSVGTGCKVTFHMNDTAGRVWTDTLDKSGNHEAEMRYNGSLYMIITYGDYLAAHWAATMFGRHPEAHQVTVQFEQYEPGSMEEFRAGVRPEWKTTYTRAFLRKDAFGL